MKTLLPLALLLPACTAPFEVPDVGDPFYQTATVCTRLQLEETFSRAAFDWYEASSGRVNMRVEVGWSDECDVLADWKAGRNAGETLPGIVYINPNLASDPEGMRVVATHELGHLLLGHADVAHSNDPESVMHYPGYPGAVVKPEDVAKLP